MTVVSSRTRGRCFVCSAMRATWVFSWIVCAVMACDGAATDVCEGVGQQGMPASAEGRWLLGVASRYPVDTSMGALKGELARSQRERRNRCPTLGGI